MIHLPAQVWDKAPAADRVSLTLPITVPRARSCCRSISTWPAADAPSLISTICRYLTTGAGALLDIIRKMRVVLEAYCRTTYPTTFSSPTGSAMSSARFAKAAMSIRLTTFTTSRSDQRLHEPVHHGEDKDVATPAQIGPTELTGFARRTLRVVNALQA